MFAAAEVSRCRRLLVVLAGVVFGVGVGLWVADKGPLSLLTQRGTGQVTAKTSPAIVVAVVREGKYREGKYRVDEMRDGLVASLGEYKWQGPNGIERFSVIAWCIKTHSDKQCSVPRIFEEAIVEVLLDDGKGNRQWLLAYLMRLTNTTDEYAKRWKLFGGLIWRDRRSYSSAPTDREIGEFIHGTNFGNNEVVYPWLRVLGVVTYRTSGHILSVLQDGLSAEEKGLRQAEWDANTGCW